MYRRNYKKKSTSKDTVNVEGAVQSAPNKGKYGARKVEFEGLKFDSTMEFHYYQYLQRQKEIGEILDIELQTVFLLQPKFRYKDKAIREINYKSDFKVTYKDGSVIVFDVKGMPPTPDFKLKWKMLKYLHQEMDFRCVKSIGKAPYTWETLKI